MTCGPYDGGSQYQQLTIMMGGRSIGRLVFQVCHQCRTGYVAKISVDEAYQGRGIASRALWAVRAEVSGYRWSTSGQELAARTFWRRLARHRGGYQTARPCQHIRPNRTTHNRDRG
jgi:GNAT superfamily N-acetyltransferase